MQFIKNISIALKIKLFTKKVQRLYRTYIFKGNEVHCKLCGWQGQMFFKGKCPKCNSLPRTRLIPYAFTYFKLISQKHKVLHVAPNVNEYKFIKRHCDSDKFDRLNIRKVAHVNIVQDLTQTTLKDNTYNLVIAWHVLEHIPEDVKAIAEVYRMLRPGGKFLVSVPIYPLENPKTYEDANIPYSDFEKVHGHDDHCRSCGLDYYKRFEKIGFVTDTLRVKDISESEVLKYGLSKAHLVWCFSKPPAKDAFSV